MRIDQWLVSRGLVPSRSAAQRLIERGAVRWLGPRGWMTPRKAGDEVPEGCEIQITDDAELRWVSRGGLKLEGALQAVAHEGRGALAALRLPLPLRERAGERGQPPIALDVGQSTGGFTEVLLHAGCARVVGVDVGHGQLHPKLAADPRVVALEGLNARELNAAALGTHWPTGGFDVITGDLSFISLTLVLPALAPLLAPHGRLLMLVKPQFELQPADIGKGGLVKDASAYSRVETRVREACAACGLSVLDWLASPITGGDGNREFFVLAGQAAPAA
ncbi:hemolysin [Vitreoscilla filiformis]|jgi:23S rRNA (cytidine1920-2'-O)/16S rRNA (cytidine1409-2'-O)-methyltransferase|uniref:Hemolysin n=1 Tax=Vitreoscilla filiformis TaxID=63 RepID=A0A221KE85_VITFI|nr:TlyA family RNA methyltransferase [Vitreoscilla filiformis]ASM77123.1 hemolysin [Vitreoscilla filiformis]